MIPRVRMGDVGVDPDSYIYYGTTHVVAYARREMITASANT